mgnify:FL=1
MYKVQGIIFDLDGTLVELPVNWREVISSVENMLGIKVRSLLELYPKIWGTEKYELVSRMVERFEMASLDGFRFLDDSPQLLRDLSSKYQLGLITFQGINVAKRITEMIGINGLLMATRDDAPTRIEQISRIVSATRYEFEDFLVVGDLLNDVYSALKVGCHAVLVDRYNRYDDVDEIEKKITVIPNLKKLPKVLYV